MLMWIAFLVASILILTVTGSALHTAPSSSGGTLVDEFGAVLPYALIGGLLLYYFLRPTRKREVPLRGTRSFFSNLGIMLVLCVAVFVAALVLKIVSMPSTGQVGPANLLPPPVSNPQSGPGGEFYLSPILFLGTLVAIVAFAVVLGISSLRRRFEATGETVDMNVEDVTAETPSSPFVVDDLRRAILHSYVLGRNLMVGQGVMLNEGMTAREYEKKVDKCIEDASGDFVPLTRLFEEARFSIHPMGQPEKERAENHYRNLKTTSERETGKGPKNET
jgi:hypothetical protein